MNYALLRCPHSLEQIRTGRPLLRWMPKNWVAGLTRFLKATNAGPIGLSGAQGWLWELPVLPDQLDRCRKRTIQAAKKIQGAGAKCVGLEAGLRHLAPVFAQQGLAVSQGAAFQVATALSALLMACNGENLRGVVINPIQAPGAVCARFLASRVRHLTLMGNFLPPLERLANKLLLTTGTAPVVTRFNPELLAAADIIIDLACSDFSSLPLGKAVVWQPFFRPDHGSADMVINELLISLDTDLVLEGDLPPGLLRAATAETILRSLESERVWPRDFAEVTLDQVLRLASMAKVLQMTMAGYINYRKVCLFPHQFGFDKLVGADYNCGKFSVPR